VIFIDKFNVSGIETMILDLAVAGNCLMGRQSTGETAAAKEQLDFYSEGWPPLESPPES